jgi:hypothetical protein
MRLITTLVRAPFWLLSRVLGLVLGFAVFALLALSIVAFGPFLTLGYGLKYGIRFPITLLWAITTPYVIKGLWGNVLTKLREGSLSRR